MALMTVTPGTRILGGLSAPRTGMAESFQAGLQANLTRQDTKQAMRAREQDMRVREQDMRVRESEEARRQVTFEQQQEAYRRQQAAAAEARNREAQRQALMAQYRAPGVGEAPVIFQPQAQPVVTPAVQPVNTTGYSIGVPVPTGTPRGRYRPDEGAGGGSDVLGGGAGADTLPPVPAGAIRVELGGIAYNVFPDKSAPQGVRRVVYAEDEWFTSAGNELSPDSSTYDRILERVAGQLDVGSPAAPAAQPAGLTVPPGTLQPAAARAPTRTFMTPESMAARAGMAGTLAGYGVGVQPTRTRYYGVDFDVYPGGRIVNLATNSEIPATPEFAALRSAVEAMASGDPLQMMTPGSPRPEAGQELPAGVEAPGLYTTLLGDFPGAARADEYLAEGLINDLEYQQLTRGTRAQQAEVITNVVRRRDAGEQAPPVPSSSVDVQITGSTGEEATVTVDEGPVLSFGGGLRTAESDSPIDFILGQPVGSGAVAPIPRELPRLNAAIQQGVTERQRLVDAYNAFYQAGFAEDANAYLTSIQNLDQTLIRLQGEQALNDLTIGYPERASMVLSHYLGANAQLVLNQKDAYDLYVNGQPVENEDLRGMTPQDAADLVRRYYDSGYQESMQEVRNTYLTERAKRQAEQDVKDEAALQALESAGFEVMGKETINNLGDGWRSKDPRTGKEYFAYVVGIDEDGIPQTRVIEVPTGAKLRE